MAKKYKLKKARIKTKIVVDSLFEVLYLCLRVYQVRSYSLSIMLPSSGLRSQRSWYTHRSEGAFCLGETVKTIPLPNGKETIVDDFVYNWGLKPQYVNGYAAIWYDENDVRKWKYLHRVIMGAPVGLDIDHINHNKLDNRCSNLRFCTDSENSQNQNIRTHHLGKPKTSKYKGVSWFRPAKLWRSYIRIDGETRWLGYFKLELDAARAYNEAANKHYGEFACINNMECRLAKSE